MKTLIVCFTIGLLMTAYFYNHFLADSIQGRLNAGGVVTLPAGVTKIHKPLRVGSNTILRGNPKGSTLLLSDGSECPVVLVQGTNSVVESFTIDGNREKQLAEFSDEGYGNDGILVLNSFAVQILNMKCCHCRSGGVVLSCSQQCFISDLESWDNQFDGLACSDVQGCIFKWLTLHDNIAAGLSLDNDFRDNTVSDLVLVNNRWGIFMRQSSDNIFWDVLVKCHGDDIIFSENCTNNVFYTLSTTQL